MKKLFWSMGMTAAIALGVFILWSPNEVSWICGAESKPACIKVNIDNFSIGPMTPTVPAGTTVTGTSKDDPPPTVVSTSNVVASPALDTDEQFDQTFTKFNTNRMEKFGMKRPAHRLP